MTEREMLHELIARCERNTDTVLLDVEGHLDPGFEQLFLEWLTAQYEFHQVDTPAALLQAYADEEVTH